MQYDRYNALTQMSIPQPIKHLSHQPEDTSSKLFAKEQRKHYDKSIRIANEWKSTIKNLSLRNEINSFKLNCDYLAVFHQLYYEHYSSLRLRIWI